LREIAEAARTSFPEDRAVPEPAPCLAGKGGAYSFSLHFTGVDPSDYGGGYLADLRFLHADPEGHVATSQALQAASTATYATQRKLAGVVDYDADGTDELLVELSNWEFEGNGDYNGEIWHVVGDRIERYPPAGKIAIARFEDMDADGLPELLVATPFQGVINGCGPDGNYIEFGPQWPMHALRGGSFAFDETSRSLLRRSCPKRPVPLVPRTLARVDNTELRQRLACAVAWGMPSQAIVRELEQHCPQSSAPPDECAHEGVLPICVNLPALAKWAAMKPPFALQ
jgi:hypothetical protein